jgi:hypothetical protein
LNRFSVLPLHQELQIFLDIFFWVLNKTLVKRLPVIMLTICRVGARFSLFCLVKNFLPEPGEINGFVFGS